MSIHGRTAIRACQKWTQRYRQIIALNAKTNIGKTAFIMACQLGLKEIVKILLDQSDRRNVINLNVRDNDGHTIAHLNGRKDGK